MDLWLKFVWIIGPLILATYLSTRENITRRVKIIVWAICVAICISGASLLVKEKVEKGKETEITQFYRNLLERQELHTKGLPIPYIDGLGEHPLLKHSFNEGQKYGKEFKFKEAIKEYKKCLSHPYATEENKVAANIIIGNCYYRLAKLKEAERHYKEALHTSKKVKEKNERLQGKASAYNNMGLVYQDRGEWDKALEFYQKSLKTKEQVGDIHGMAQTWGNMGVLEMQRGNNEDAAILLEKAAAVFEQLGDVVNAQKARNLLNQARAGGKLDIATLLKDPDRLLQMLEAAEGIPADKKEELKAILKQIGNE
jgi:tetratricopeptide (TPR) repeat protein